MDSHQTEVLIVTIDLSSLAVAIELGSRAIPCIILESSLSMSSGPAAPVSIARVHDHLRRWGIDSTQYGNTICSATLVELLKRHVQTLPSVRFFANAELSECLQDEHGVRSSIRGLDASSSTIVSHYLVDPRESPVPDRYRDRRVCMLGKRRPLHASCAAYALSEAIADGVDLGWKLAAVLQGWGGPRLLDSYQAERRPVHRRVTDNLSPGKAVSRVRCPYQRSPIIARPANDQRARLDGGHRSVEPGAPAPHFSLLDGSTLHDGLGPDFTLLATGGWTSADLMLAQGDAQTLGLPLAVLRAPVPALADLYGARLALIRPDRRVAWCGDAWPYEGIQLLALVSGH